MKEFFQRLQEGLPLTSAEKLNSIHSKLREFLAEQAKHPFFERVSASDRRYGHFDILAKVAAIEIDGLDVGLRYDNLRAVFESQSQFSPESNVAKRIMSALDYVNKGFDDKGARLLRNRTTVQALLTLVCRLIQSDNAANREDTVCNFFVNFLEELNKQVELGQKATEPDYLEFQRTVNANVKEGPRIRQRILLSRLLALSPDSYGMFDPAAMAETGLKPSIAADAGEIVLLISSLNEQYSAKHGEDLFKATNKTALAQASIGKPIIDFTAYNTFVENLYFLFHESTGTRLEGRRPESFKDVNTLRTGLQHDLDHGEEKKVQAKKKRTGEVFSKYSGEVSPAGLAPERFIVVQANLLRGLKRDLKCLAP